MSRSIHSCRLGAAVTMLFAGYAGVASAQNPAAAAPPTRTAVVDLVRVFNDSQQIKDLNELFRQRRQALSDEAANRRKVLDEAEIKLRAYRPDSPDFDKVRREFSDQQIAFKVWTESKQQEVRGDEFRWMDLMYQDSCVVIQKLAGQRGIDLVMLSEPFSAEAAQEDLAALQAQIRARKVVYFSQRIDLTASVVEELNRAYQARGGAAAIRGGAPATAAPASPAPAPAAPTAPPKNAPQKKGG